MNAERPARLLQDAGAAHEGSMLADLTGLSVFPSEFARIEPHNQAVADSSVQNTEQRVYAIREAIKLLSREVNELQAHTSAVAWRPAWTPTIARRGMIVGAALAALVLLAGLSWPLVSLTNDSTIVIPAPAPPLASWARPLPPPVLQSFEPSPMRVRTPDVAEPNKSLGAFSGLLGVESAPSGARVFVNQRLAGITPLRVRLPATSYAIWVEHDGYQRWTAGVAIPADRLTRVRAELEAAVDAPATSAANPQSVP
jgi:PEGA domain